MPRSRRLRWLVVIALVVIFTACFWLHPKLMDDWWFIQHNRHYLRDPSWKSFLQSVTENLSYRFFNDNGRIPNLFGAPIMLLPDWVRAVGLGLCVGLMIYLGALITGVWRRSIFGFSVLVASFVFLIPWFDSMFINMFPLNYLVASVLMLWVGYLALYHPDMKWGYAAAGGLVLGMWHEAFTAAAIGGILGLLIAFPSYRKASVWAWCAGMIMAMVYFINVPATGNKMDSYLWISLDLSQGKLLGLPFYLYVTIVCLGLAIPRWRPRFFTPVMGLVFGSALGGFLLWRCFMGAYRSSWPMLMYSGLGLALVVSLFRSGKSVTGRIMAAILLLISVAQPLATVPWFVKIRHDDQAINDVMWSNLGVDSTFFVEMTTEETVPVYTLNRPNFALLLLQPSVYRRVVPAFLKDFAPERATPIGRGCEAYLYKNHIVLKDPEPGHRILHSLIGFADGKVLNIECSYTPFVTDAGTFYYASTRHAFERRHMSHIVWFEIEDYEDNNFIVADTLNYMTLDRPVNEIEARLRQLGRTVGSIY